MKARDGWDREEREALQALEDELARVRARHAADPPLDLLRAADADALPGELQARVAEHLSESEWSRALVDGARDVDHSLDREEVERVLASITRTAERHRPWFSRITLWAPLAASAAAIVIVAVLWPSRHAPAPAAPSAPPKPEATVARNEPRPFELAFQKPDVRLSVAALTWRGPTGASSLVDDLAPALDSFRQSDYARAAQALGPLERRYPNALEPPFYRGISLLFLNDPGGAAAELRKAERLADSTFTSDVAWYLAVAEQRAGRTTDARARLDALCRAAKGYAADACDGVKKIDAAAR